MGRISQVNRQRIIDIARELRPHWKEVALTMKRKFHLNVSSKTCARTWHRWAETRRSTDRPRVGRPIKCTGRKAEALCTYARHNRFQTLTDYVKFAKANLHVELTSKTAAAILRKRGLQRRVAVRKPLLSKAAKERRLQWGKRHQRFRFVDWKRVIFSDEKIFRTDNNRKSLLVTRTKSEKFKSSCIQHTVKHGLQVHVWGGVGWRGVTPLKLVRGGLNAAKYQQEIVNDIRHVARQVAPSRCRILFQQDQAPAHRAATTLRFFAQQRVELLPWPGNSPDMNIMENLWAQVATRVNKHHTLPRNENELFTRVQQAWQEVSLQSVQKLFSSIPKRIKELIKAKGGPTNY